MQQVARRRLPVYFLFDIDGALLHPCRARSWDSSDFVGESFYHTEKRGERIDVALWKQAVRCPLTSDQRHIQEVLLRPHVIPFFHHVLVCRALDTSRTQTHVLLYTRQSASYCDAVVRQILLPALEQESRGHSEGVSPALFSGLLHGQHCLQVEDNDVESRSRCSTGVPAPFGCSSEVELCDWSKTISVSPSPLTTVLIDDTSCNFRPLELATGHAILLPSFRPRVNDTFEIDACFAVPDFPDEALHDALTSRGVDCDTAVSDTAFFCAQGGGEDSESLLQFLTAFVQTCHDQRDTIEALQRHCLWTGVYHAEAAELRQRELRRRVKAHSAAVAALNFFDASRRYREAWNSFHAAREHLLVPFF